MIPDYYSSLGPFRELFQSGYAILTYHHVGARSRGVRLKGLFLSPRLFEQQLAGLHSAGFSSARMEDLLKWKAQPDRADAHPVWLTFDDGFRDVFEHALPLLAKHGAHGTLFLVANLLGKTSKWQQREGDIAAPLMDESQVRAWLAAGNEIGSHTLTHPFLTEIPPAAAREEIFASKRSLEDRFGVPINHFCYPYGDWSPAVRNLVSEAGYQTACTTVPGVNEPGTPELELRRFTARYPSRNLKTIFSRLRNSLTG